MKREKSGYKNYEDYLSTMRSYKFIPVDKELWESKFQGSEERIGPLNKK